MSMDVECETLEWEASNINNCKTFISAHWTYFVKDFTTWGHIKITKNTNWTFWASWFHEGIIPALSGYHQLMRILSLHFFSSAFMFFALSVGKYIILSNADKLLLLKDKPNIRQSFTSKVLSSLLKILCHWNVRPHIDGISLIQGIYKWGREWGSRHVDHLSCELHLDAARFHSVLPIVTL